MTTPGIAQRRPRIAEVVEEFQASVLRFEEADPDFNGLWHSRNHPEPALSQETALGDHWLSAEGAEEVFLRDFYLHENSLYWEQYGLRDFNFLRPAAQGE